MYTNTGSISIERIKEKLDNNKTADEITLS